MTNASGVTCLCDLDHKKAAQMLRTKGGFAQVASQLTPKRKSQLLLYCALADVSLQNAVLEALNDYIDATVEARISQFENQIVV